MKTVRRMSIITINTSTTSNPAATARPLPERLKDANTQLVKQVRADVLRAVDEAEQRTEASKKYFGILGFRARLG